MKTTLSNQEESIIEMMRSDKDIANYFWTHAQDIKWFSKLKALKIQMGYRLNLGCLFTILKK